MGAMYQRQMETFVGLRKEEDKLPMATAEEGVRQLAICDAARVASKTGSLTHIEYLI